MTPFLIALAAIWGLGAWAGLARGLKAGLTAGLFALILLSHALFPPGAPLPQIWGGSFAGWATLAGATALAALYASGLAWIRARVPEPEPAPGPEAPFTPTELDRYARHIVLREIGGPGQKALKQARVLAVGAGGLGSPVLLYLAAAGVGTIGVVDDDEVSNSNLQRQVIHRTADIGQPKVLSARAAMRAQNPHIAVRSHQTRLTEANAEELLAGYDLVLEGSDNFATRYLVNRVAATLGIPVVGGAISQWEGQLSVWDPANGAPCYACVFPEPPADGLAPSCAEAGVIGPLPGVIGTMMATEALKILTGAGEPLRGRLLLWDGLDASPRVIRTTRRKGCPVCG
ncbi:MAG: molybdopterin biosynthesis protein [Rhodobacterales bacterium]|nr:MAG: molybdopterin biosynthesis protein [Rhodobacterales bacterium]